MKHSLPLPLALPRFTLFALAIVCLISVGLGSTAQAAAPPAPTLAPLEAMLLEPPAASLANPAIRPATVGSLEGMLEQSAPATICTQQCPGDPAFGIAPYTPNCYTQCTPCYELGRLCGFLCDGWGLDCFPRGCETQNPSC